MQITFMSGTVLIFIVRYCIPHGDSIWRHLAVDCELHVAHGV